MRAVQSQVPGRGPLPVVGEADLDGKFVVTVMELSGEDGLLGCIQCGTCTGSCQLSSWMDYTPRRIVDMVRKGLAREVLASRAIWYCASCYYCTVRCPRGIKLTEVLYALKSLALARGYAEPGAPAPAFYRTFFEVVGRYGRLYEPGLMIGVALRSGFGRLFRLAPLGLGMLRRGKMALLPERVRAVDEVRALMERVSRGLVRR